MTRNAKHPEFAAAGYPTAKTLRVIRMWPIIAPDPSGKGRYDIMPLIQYVKAAWHWPDYVKVEGDTVTMATGGWSGNEAIVSALHENAHFWAACWQESHRGGLYKFKIPGK